MIESRGAIGRPQLTSSPRSVMHVVVALATSLLVAACGSPHADKRTSTGTTTTTTAALPAATTTPAQNAAVTAALGSTAATMLHRAGCVWGTLPAQDADMANLHVERSQLRWITRPPSSGRHIADWMPWGVYDQTPDDGYVVHNLEHGGVVIWLGTSMPSSIATAMRALPTRGDKLIVAPRDDVSGMYSTAWQRGLWCRPAALRSLSAANATTALRAWYRAVQSTGSPAEKDVPAYAGGVTQPRPERDVSLAPPTY